MSMFDFNIFYGSGQALLLGSSPYGVDGFISPIYLAFLFVPFALLPKIVSYIIFLILNICLLVFFCKKKVIWALLSFPVIFSLFIGQVDMLIIMGILVGSPWSLSLILAKPQVGFVVLPWLIRHLRLKDLWKAALPAAILIALSFLFRPDWVKEWQASQPEMGYYARHASNLIWAIPRKFSKFRVQMSIGFLVILFPLGIFLNHRKSSWLFIHLIAPLTNIYSSVVLFEWIGPLEMILSWIAVLLVKGDIHNGMPLFMMTLAILVKWIWKDKKQSQKLLSLPEKDTVIGPIICAFRSIINRSKIKFCDD